jgi:hypothetical protein
VHASGVLKDLAFCKFCEAHASVPGAERPPVCAERAIQRAALEPRVTSAACCGPAALAAARATHFAVFDVESEGVDALLHVVDSAVPGASFSLDALLHVDDAALAR